MRFRRIFGTVFAAATLVVTGMVTAGPASAATINMAPGCGATITTAPGNTINITVNVGPCASDGLIVTGTGFTVNLQGHTVFGVDNVDGTRNATGGDQAGIRMNSATNVTIRNGTIHSFDSGVLIDGLAGSRQDTLSSLYIHDNINDGMGAPCDLGEGVTILDSNNNQVVNNRVNHNGPYGGVSIVENSDGNVVKSNPEINDNNLVGVGGGCGNTHQDEGIRIEGPGAQNNRAEANNIQRSLLAGIGLHGSLTSTTCTSTDTRRNSDNVFVNNYVRGSAGDAEADGIETLPNGDPGVAGGTCLAFRNTFTGNNVVANQGYGMYFGPTSTDNTINSNNVTSNGIDGIFLDGPNVHDVFTDIGPTDLTVVQPPGQPPFANGTDYRALAGSGSGNVTGKLVPIGAINVTQPIPFDSATSGCTASDFTAAGFQPGDVALIQRGFCGRAEKVNNAVAAGASAVVFFNEGSPGRTGLLTAGVSPVNIPVVGTTFAVGQTLYNLTLAGPVRVHVATNTTIVPTPVSSGAERNTLNANRGTGNGEHDGHDANPNCDANVWTANKFGTVNQACVKAGNGTGVVKTINP